MPDSFVNGRVLRDYQQDAVREALKQEIGILQLATGAGKTECAIELIRKLGVPTLFIVDKVDLLNQTYDRICNTLGLNDKIVGKIGGGNKDPAKVINVATIQTLISDINKHRDVLENSVLVIFDECHKVASKSYTTISKYLLSAQYRIGLSATPKREDNNEMAIYSVCGYPIFKVTTQELIQRNFLVKPTLYFFKNFNTKEEVKGMESESMPNNTINETKDYPLFYDRCVLQNNKRNNIVKKIVEKYPEDHILILVKLKVQGKMFAEMLNVPYFSGELKPKERKQLMEDFNTKKIRVMVGTVSIFAEALDFPSLDTLINTVGNSGDVKSVQMIGRPLRTFIGKTGAKYFDFIDENTFLKASSIKRMKAFKEEGHSIQIIDVEKNKTFI
ncbi:MAG: DEAD/DEAH box helicase [bacterium]